MDIEQAVARVIAIARQDTGKTAAEFDYDIKLQGLGGFYAPIGQAIYQIAREHLSEQASVDQVEAYALRLREQLQPALDRYAAKCRDREYLGWSGAARSLGQRIHYAD